MTDLSNEVRQAIEKYGDHPTGATVRDLMDAIEAEIASAIERAAGVADYYRTNSIVATHIANGIRALASPPTATPDGKCKSDGTRLGRETCDCPDHNAAKARRQP